jgi:hypothetical protein
MALSLTTQQIAAYKAWDTIRANQLAAKRTEAALKAWATRRANERSERAYRAWDTRDAAEAA